MKLSDLDKNDAIRIAEARGFLRILDEAGVGKIVKGVNTTPDVQPGEIPRQAAKMGFKTTEDGIPPVSRSDGKFEAIQLKKKGATNRSRSH